MARKRSTEHALTQNALKGMALSIFAASCIAAMNLFAKLLGPYMGAMDVTFTRNVVSLLILLCLMPFISGFRDLKTKRPLGHIVRALCGTAGLTFGFWTFQLMPMSQATLFLFTQPLFVVLLSYPVLGEKVGWHRIAAVIVGFSGILIVAGGPTGDLPLSSMAIGLATGFFNATVAICLRWLGDTENAGRTVFYFLTFGMVITGALVFSPLTDSHIPAMSWTSTVLLFSIGLGFFGTFSLIAKTQSYRLAPAAVITPTNYTIIIWAVIFDYFIWDKAPELRVLLGATIIIASNLFIIYRENLLKKKAALISSGLS